MGLRVIEKAKEACKTSGNGIMDHFSDLRKTIAMPKGASKEIEDIMLTRYAVTSLHRMEIREKEIASKKN